VVNAHKLLMSILVSKWLGGSFKWFIVVSRRFWVVAQFQISLQTMSNFWKENVKVTFKLPEMHISKFVLTNFPFLVYFCFHLMLK